MVCQSDHNLLSSCSNCWMHIPHRKANTFPRILQDWPMEDPSLDFHVRTSFDPNFLHSNSPTRWLPISINGWQISNLPSVWMCHYYQHNQTYISRICAILIIPIFPIRTPIIPIFPIIPISLIISIFPKIPIFLIIQKIWKDRRNRKIWKDWRNRKI